MNEVDDLSGLDELAPGPPAPVPVVAGAAPAAAPVPGPSVGDLVESAVPPKKRKSGAQYRQERARKTGKADRPAAVKLTAGPSPSSSSPPPPKKPEPSPEEREGLEVARRVIEDPDTLDFIEGLYRMPFELWADAVKVEAVIPDPPRVQRAAKLIRQCMGLWGPKAWMRYLPLVFLAVALGEDVVRGAKAVREAKAAAGSSTDTREPRREGSATPPPVEGARS